MYHYNFLNLIIIGAALHGVVFAFIVLLSKKYRSTATIYLSLVVLFLSLNNVYYWLADTNISENIPFFEYLYIPWNILILPVYYYFVLSYIRVKNTKPFFKSKLTLPFLVSVCFHFLLLVNTLLFHFPVSTTFIHWFYYLEEYFSILFTLFIIFKTLQRLKKYEDENAFYSIKKVPIQTKWLKKLLLFGVFICCIWGVLVFTSQLYQTSTFDNFIKYFLWLSMSLLIYWLGYLGIYYTGIFKQRIEIRKKDQSIKRDKQAHNINATFTEIKTLIQTEKLFKNPHLSLSFLSEKLQLNESYISQLFSENSLENFSEFTNKLRVKDVKKSLKDNSFSCYTIVAIGLEAGFNSKSAFYAAFKKEVGTTPTMYRKQNLS